MNKYIKKPVEIEAIQWTGKNTKKIKYFCNNGDGWNCGQTNPDKLEIYTLEGTMLASVGDYIIKGINGEIYPCKPDIFEKTYDKTPTLEEVKKEWEELGYEYQKNCNGWQLVNEEKEEVIVIEDDNKLYAKTDTNGKLILYFTLQEHQLLTKTFRALGWFDE